ncbi:hypothetical protein [Neptuniibacter halophilus]|uniref:hypothetical protein n=1 Tax=Neptuniibacter halophilus TaxID=651666 RepID=UPI002573BEDC|nr:hypothetical protein [Neptuniibacter halophilus]
MHTFELSGLGKAPFHLITPKQSALDKGEIFWCEHCGTTIKHRNFIKSADGKVSIVGIDCLKKTGDQGLIDGQRRLVREARHAEQEVQRAKDQMDREAIERERNGGLSNNELIQQLQTEVEQRCSNLAEEMDIEETVLPFLTKHGFETSMQLMAYTGKPYSEGMLKVIAEILAKKKSGARKNSAKYNAQLPEAQEAVAALQKRLVSHQQNVAAIKSKILSIRCG